MSPAPSNIQGRCRESKKYVALYMKYINDVKLEQKEGAG
jgi:hypothetical protein